MASLNVGSAMRYQAAALGRSAAALFRSSPPAPTGAPQWREAIRSYGDQREQAQQGQCGAQNGEIRPLALCLYAKMHTRFLDVVFTRQRETNQAGIVAGVAVGSVLKECGWFMLAGRVADQHPTDRHRLDAGIVLNRGIGRNPQRALLRHSIGRPPEDHHHGLRRQPLWTVGDDGMVLAEHCPICLRPVEEHGSGALVRAETEAVEARWGGVQTGHHPRLHRNPLRCRQLDLPPPRRGPYRGDL